MKVIYDKELSQIVLITENDILTILHIDTRGIDTPIFNVDERVPLDIATKLFQRWHQIDQSADPEFIARALDDALNSELSICAKVCDFIKVHEGQTSDCGVYDSVYKTPPEKALKQVFRKTGLYEVIEDSDSVKHNITEDRVDYFIDGQLKGWLPIIRKGIDNV